MTQYTLFALDYSIKDRQKYISLCNCIQEKMGKFGLRELKIVTMLLLDIVYPMVGSR
jgi:hypothetical protein